MGVTERRERDKQRRREDILQTARQLFFEKGFRDTTIDDIARASELARGTIYLYFESKEEIYASVMEQGLEILRGLIEGSIDLESDALTNLLNGHDGFMRFHDEFPHYYKVLMMDQMEITDQLSTELKGRLDVKTDEIATLIAANLQRGIAEGVFRPMGVKEVAFLQMGIAMGFAQMMDKCGRCADTLSDRQQSRQTMHDLIALGVVARPR